MKTITKLMSDFRELPFPWRVQRLRDLAMGSDMTALEKFIGKHPAAVKWELTYKPDFPTASARHRSLLHETLIYARHEAMEVLLKHGASPVAPDRYGYTPLQCILGIGWPHTPDIDPMRLEMAKTLIAYGAPVEQRDKEGKTPLHLACIAHNVDAAALLLAHGAKLEKVVSKDGGGPLEVCLHVGYPCAAPPQEKMLEWLLKNTKADPDQPNNAGMTPLFFALNGQMAKLLVAAGADITHIDSFGQNPVTSVMGWVEGDSRKQYMASAVETRRRYEQAKVLNACHRNVTLPTSGTLKLKKPALTTS